MRRRLACLLLALSLWAAPSQAAFTGYGAVYSWIPGTFAGKNYDGTTAGILSADTYTTPTGLTVIGPGLEGQSLPPYRSGACYIWQRYDAYRVVGPPFESWAGGSRVFRADSSGTDVVGTASADIAHARTSVQVDQHTLASLPADIDGTIRYCSDCLKFSLPCTGGGSGTFAERINGEWDCGGSLASADTVGLAVLAGRTDGQTLLGSSRTSFNALGFLLLRGYADLSNSGTASLFLGTDAIIRGSSIQFLGQGQTTGLAYSTGTNFVNGIQTGSHKFWGAGGVSLTPSGAPIVTVKSGISTSIASPTLVVEGKVSQTAPVLDIRNGSDVSVASIDLAGNITGNYAATGSSNYLQGTDIASTASVTLPTGNVFRVTGTADITSISTRTNGTIITLMFTGTAATNGMVDDNAGLNLNGNLLYVPNETITLVRVSGNWIEIGRSNN